MAGEGGRVGRGEGKGRQLWNEGMGFHALRVSALPTLLFDLDFSAAPSSRL